MKYFIIFFLTFLFLNTISFGQTLPDTVVDIDGNVYHAVKIGTQIWMVENLKVTHYSNGDAIPNVTDSSQWSNLINGAYCNYNNDTNIANTYGRLYNWYAVNDDRNLAPKGWHVPSITEWTVLISFLGGDSVADGKLKETGTSHWQSSNSEATNKTGFTALPGGYRNDSGFFFNVRNGGNWWSSTESNTYNALFLGMYYRYVFVYVNDDFEMNGFSVRCIKD